MNDKRCRENRKGRGIDALATGRARRSPPRIPLSLGKQWKKLYSAASLVSRSPLKIKNN